MSSTAKTLEYKATLRTQQSSGHFFNATLEGMTSSRSNLYAYINTMCVCKISLENVWLLSNVTHIVHFRSYESKNHEILRKINFFAFSLPRLGKFIFSHTPLNL